MSTGGKNSGGEGRGKGVGIATEVKETALGENDVLSNRDKKLHGRGRGLDSAATRTEQLQDHVGNRRPRAEED